MPNTTRSEVFTANATGEVIPIGNSPLKSVQIAGTFTASVAIQLSNDATLQDWYTWKTYTAAVMEDIDVDAASARAVVSGYVNGPVEVHWHQVS
jgi:hypothetical protein